MSFEAVELVLEPPLASIRFNRPEKLNAFNRQLLTETLDAFAQVASDDRIRTVILTGNGRCFSSGFDIGGSAEGKPHTVVEWKNYTELGQELGRRIWSFPKPVVASVRSYALGGACEFAMLCDLTIAADDAMFGEPEIRFGSGSPTLIMPWVVPLKIAKELIYSGKLIGAQRAYEIGMVNDVVPASELDRRTRHHARQIAQISPLAVRLAKEALNRTYEIMGLHPALAYNANLTAILDGTETEEFRVFEKVRAESGLKAALDWREQQFRDLEQLD